MTEGRRHHQGQVLWGSEGPRLGVWAFPTECGVEDTQAGLASYEDHFITGADDRWGKGSLTREGS